MKIGRTMEAALQETADRLGTPEFQFFVITLAIQRETGGNLAETLSNLADVLRKRAQMKLKIRAMSSEFKASAYIVGALPFIVFAPRLHDEPRLHGQVRRRRNRIPDAGDRHLGVDGLRWTRCPRIGRGPASADGPRRCRPQLLFSFVMTFAIRLTNGAANRILRKLGIEPAQELRSACSAQAWVRWYDSARSGSLDQQC